MLEISFKDLISSFKDEFKVTMTIADFKSMISKYTKIEEQNLRIQVLIDENGLSDKLDTKKELFDCLHIYVYDITHFPININFNFYSTTLFLDLNKKIEELKQAINYKLKIPIERQEFYCDEELVYNDDYFQFEPFNNKINFKLIDAKEEDKTLLKVKYQNGDIKQIYTDLLLTGYAFNGILNKNTKEPVIYDLFIFENKKIPLNELLIFYNIKNGDLIELKERNNIKITVKTLAGEPFTLNASPNDEIFILKYLIELKIGIPIKEQRLIYEGKQLIDNRTIADYNIKKESSIHLSIRLIG